MRRIVHGTPMTPTHLLESLRGGSFCVSFARPDQLELCIELVGDDGILLLDNGAFSIWMAQQKGKKLPSRLRFDSREQYRERFWEWANDVQDRCDNAIAVIPDVIEGSEQENLIEMSWAIRYEMARYPERTMSIWHLDESQDFLATQLKLMNFVGLGSCAEFDVQKNRAGYLEQMQRVYTSRAAIKALHGRCPWIHLMRGLGVFKEVAWAESADSTNVAVNSNRHKARYGDHRAKAMATRINSEIQSAADEIPIDPYRATNWSE